MHTFAATGCLAERRGVLASAGLYYAGQSSPGSLAPGDVTEEARAGLAAPRLSEMNRCPELSFPRRGAGAERVDHRKAWGTPFSFPSVSPAVMTTERGLTGVDQSLSGSGMSHLANSFTWKLQNLSGPGNPSLQKPQQGFCLFLFCFLLLSSLPQREG